MDIQSDFVYSVPLVRAALDELVADAGGDVEMRADIVRAANRLPLRYRRALVLRAQGYTYAELAARVRGGDVPHAKKRGKELVGRAETALVRVLNGGPPTKQYAPRRAA